MDNNDSIIVIVTAYNEADRIGATIGALRGAFGEATRIVVADDASTDGTPEVVERAGAELVRAPRNIGKGGVSTLAARRVMSAALADDEPIIVLCDGDLAATADQLTALVASVRADECDLAVAAFARKVGGGFGFAVGYAHGAIKRLCGLDLRA